MTKVLFISHIYDFLYAPVKSLFGGNADQGGALRGVKSMQAKNLRPRRIPHRQQQVSLGRIVCTQRKYPPAGQVAANSLARPIHIGIAGIMVSGKTGEIFIGHALGPPRAARLKALGNQPHGGAVIRQCRAGLLQPGKRRLRIMIAKPCIIVRISGPRAAPYALKILAADIIELQIPLLVLDKGFNAVYADFHYAILSVSAKGPYPG